MRFSSLRADLETAVPGLLVTPFRFKLSTLEISTHGYLRECIRSGSTSDLLSRRNEKPKEVLEMLFIHTILSSDDEINSSVQLLVMDKSDDGSGYFGLV